MVSHSLVLLKFVLYFNDTRFGQGIRQTEGSVKGAWLLGFVPIGGYGGLDM